MTIHSQDMSAFAQGEATHQLMATGILLAWERVLDLFIVIARPELVVKTIPRILVPTDSRVRLISTPDSWLSWKCVSGTCAPTGTTSKTAININATILLLTILDQAFVESRLPLWHMMTKGCISIFPSGSGALHPFKLWKPVARSTWPRYLPRPGPLTILE